MPTISTTQDYRRGMIPDWVLDEDIPIEVRRDAVAYWNAQRRLRGQRTFSVNLWLTIPLFWFFILTGLIFREIPEVAGFAFVLSALFPPLPIKQHASDSNGPYHQVPLAYQTFQKHNWRFDGDALKPSSWGKYTQ